MIDDNYKYSEITEMIELRNARLEASQQVPIKVFYEEIEVGIYFSDILVNEVIIVELKAAESLCEEHEIQLINYLKATEMEVGLLLNFRKKPQIKRKVFSNEFKDHF